MTRKIVVVMRDSSIIESEWYSVDYNSEPWFPDYSDNTKQDFDELLKLLNDNGIGSNDYSRWFTMG
jgi:CRISPR/Cas system CSM-associated protein Csm4 (group 5 of RAMP superfamily)